MKVFCYLLILAKTSQLVSPLQPLDNVSDTQTLLVNYDEVCPDVLPLNDLSGDPLSAILLHSLAQVTPTESFAEKALNQGRGLYAAVSDIFQDKEEALLKYCLWGFVSMALGAVWLAVFCLWIIPMFVSKTARRKMCCCIKGGTRLNPAVSSIVFGIPWILGAVFAVIVIYYAAWLLSDYDSATCRPILKTKEMLLDGVDDGTFWFPGIKAASTAVQETATLAANVAAQSEEGYLDVSFLQKQVLTRMWQPIAVYSSLWERPEVTWATRQGVSVSVSGKDTFQMELLSNVPEAWSDQSRLCDELVDAEGSSYLYTISRANVYWGTTSITQAFRTFANELVTLKETIIDTLATAVIVQHNELLRPINLLIDQRKNFVTFFALTITLGSVSVLGLALSGFHFVRHFQRPEACLYDRKGLIRAASTLSVFAIWGCLLLETGGAAMAGSYFISDTCQIVDNVLQGRKPELWEPFLNVTSDSPVVEKCLLSYSSGTILPQVNETWDALADVRSAVEQGAASNAIESPEFTSARKERLSSSTIVPILPTFTTDPADVMDLFRVGLEYATQQLDTVSASVLGSQSQWTAYLEASGNTLPGIQVLLSVINTQCSACIFPYCDEGSNHLVVSPESIAIPLVSDVRTLIHTPNLVGLVTALAVTEEARIWLAECAPIDLTLAASRRWWWAFYLLAVRSYSLYDGWRIGGLELVTGFANDTESTLFHVSYDLANVIKDGVRSVHYAEWKTLLSTNLENIIDAHQAENFTSLVASTAASDFFFEDGRSSYAVIERADCRAVSSGIQETKKAMCDSLGGDVVAASTLTVWLGTVHLIGFVICLDFWLIRQRAVDEGVLGDIAEVESDMPLVV
eukprot:Blabericola_migrator_1__12300@NODE_769_length_6592_cov_104_272490_g547_i0_p1_GENE_NODE_769_length_6592_cov_104_272490_g547_i0NODE_769_length_6592_cov_104_272490_g547_i0_p1_ORF_typecomplete_len859_score146_58DUF996/PF06195_13/0_082DUF996/PF06195_13/1_7e037tm_1/PF00001_21/0_187tm_1/PF00001_21/2_2e03_NODE_769_length_6592_cov_104_272490_g547_i039696545